MPPVENHFFYPVKIGLIVDDGIRVKNKRSIYFPKSPKFRPVAYFKILIPGVPKKVPRFD